MILDIARLSFRIGLDRVHVLTGGHFGYIPGVYGQLKRKLSRLNGTLFIFVEVIEVILKDG